VTAYIMNKYKVPESLIKYIGNDFDWLIPTDYVPDKDEFDDIDDYNDELNEKREILQECLDGIDAAIAGESIYRAILVNNLNDAIDDIKTIHYLGEHWSTCFEQADISYEYPLAVECDDRETNEPRSDFMNRKGVIIIEGKITSIDAIHFDQTIDLFFSVGEEEHEILIDDIGVEVIRIGVGSRLGRARRDFKQKQENGCLHD